MKKCRIIYKTKNLVNGKIYIGQDSYNNDKYLGSGLLLKRAISKYGKNNFKKEIIEYCDTQEELDEREKYWIKFYNSQDEKIGYNISPGGQGGIICDIESNFCGKNNYINKMSEEEREKHLNTYRRGKNYWLSKGFNSQEEIDNWIHENLCGKNHSHRKGKTEEEYQQWLDENRRGENFWLNKLSKEDKEKYINDHYKGNNNPIKKGKTEEEYQQWLDKYRRGENSPNAKFLYTITTNTGEVITGKCMNEICEKYNLDKSILRFYIELSEGKRKSYVPRKKEYQNWTVVRKKIK